MAAVDRRGFSPDSDLLLRSLAEQLKLPLLQINQLLELAKNGQPADLGRMETITEMALRLVDGYVLSTQLNSGQLELQIEPVSVSAVLLSAADSLKKIAHEYSCTLEIDLAGKYGPVMADRKSLEAAVTALGFAMIEATDRQAKKPRLILAAHRSRGGIVAGAFGGNGQLSGDVYRRAKLLYGRARQPLPTLAHSAGAGFFVADSLLSMMSAGLQVSRHSKMTGLAATLLPNPQLTLV